LVINKSLVKAISIMVAIALFILAANIIGRGHLNSDKKVSELTQFLNSERKVLRRIGDVKEISILNITTFDGTTAESPYRKYKIKIIGLRGNLIALVKITSIPETGDENIVLEKFWD
jgi:hypothetical protein